MPVSIEDVQADIVPDREPAAPATEPSRARGLDMDKVVRELRREDERRARLMAD